MRLVISDVDGTLVTPSKTLTVRSVKAANALRRAGVAFTLVSSRPPLGMESFVKRLALHLPFAAFNGGSLVSPDLRPIHAHRLAAAVARTALDVLAQRKIQAWVFAKGAWFVRDPLGARIAHEQLTLGFAPTVTARLADVADRVDKIVGVSDEVAALAECEAEMRRALGDAATVGRSQPYYLDISHPLANKGEAVRTLAGLAGVTLAQTAVIGDMANDIAMFDVAGLSIAMGQAPAEVKARAQAVTTANTQDGFARAVELFVLPRAPPMGKT